MQIDLTAPCILFLGHRQADGYGHVFREGRVQLAHRYAWTQARGPIPQGLEIDHLCRVRNCIEVRHMELVTHRENVLRGDSIVARNAKRTHCSHGHLFDFENTYITRRGNRACRACFRDRRAAKVLA